jgi:acyl-CoA reductase-like NAD-dependent aldehyde dehydrogenase
MGMPINDAHEDAEHFPMPIGILIMQVLIFHPKQPLKIPSLSNVIWATGQSLIAGNTVVLKHSEECPLSGKFIEETLNKHLPEGVFNEVYGDGAVGAQLVQQEIQMITFTGSTKTGKHLYEVAGKRFIKAVMELGGSAPAIVFEDADLESTIGNVCFNRLLNQGQCCDGLKRLIVHESQYEEVVKKLAMQFKAKKIGKADEKSTEIGPLVAKRQLDLLVSQVEDAIEKGAHIEVGGHSLEKELGGAFFEPTILTGVTRDMRVWTEEVFGPVLLVTFKQKMRPFNSQMKHGMDWEVMSIPLMRNVPNESQTPYKQVW